MMRKRPVFLTAVLAVAVFVLMCGYVRGMVKPLGQDVVTCEVEDRVPGSSSDMDAPHDMALQQLLAPGQDLLVRYSLTHVTIEPGGMVDAHRVDAPQVYYFLEGTGVMTVEDLSIAIEPGRTVYVPAQAARNLRNTGGSDLCFLAIDDPNADSKYTSTANAGTETAQAQ